MTLRLQGVLRILGFAIGLALWGQPAPLAPPALRLGVGGYHTLALGSDGSLWVWGANESGQLGDGTRDDRPLPFRARIPAGVQGRALAAGEAHSILLTEDGRVFGVGANDRGQRGGGPAEPSAEWGEVRGLPPVAQIACGPRTTYALDEAGGLWAWGDNAQGQAGPSPEACWSTPRRLPLPSLRSVAVGAFHGLGLTETGALWGWGDGCTGALGPGLMKPRCAPAPITGTPEAVQAAAGGGFSLILDRAGVVWAWGQNDHGQLGSGSLEPRAQPRVVPGLHHVVVLAAGQAHALAQGSQGFIWSWGDNNLGQLGHRAPSMALHPMLLELPMRPAAPSRWRLAVGAFHGFVYRSGGEIYGFGYNEFNQLGDWSYQNRSVPVAPRRAIP